jgi:uncharacterized surface protein with fasciclin (FAS1) repeats
MLHQFCRYLHFITKLPLPRSVTHTVYDIAQENPEFSTFVSYIDQVRLTADLRRLLPLTAFYAPNSAFEGKVTKVEEIAKSVLESHLFETLLWCDTLKEMVGSSIKSLNQQNWTISLGSNGLPCFDTYTEADGTVMKACVKKCDTLARNGIVHELDELLLYNPSETRPPSTFDDFAPTAPVPTVPTAPTVFQRPSTSATAPGASPSSTGSDGDGDIAFGAGEVSGAEVFSVVFAAVLAIGITLITII